MQLLIKALIGAALVIIIQILSASKNYVLAGLVPLFPTFAIVAHYLVGQQHTLTELKNTILFSMGSLVPYFIYLLVLYFFVDRVRLEWALLGAVVGWGVAAGLLFWVWHR